MATTKDMDSFNTRVKIYVLKDQSWEDRGTGICYCRPIDEISTKLMFVVVAEGTDDVILSSKIAHHSIYQREQGTLLIWARSPDGPNICLSFQAEQGREEAHYWIMEAQSRLTPPPSSPIDREPSPVHAPLLSPSPTNLGAPGCRPPLLHCLHDLNRIIKCLLAISDNRILEVIVQDDFILVLAGILENDPDLPGMKLGYKGYLEDASRFRQVVEIPSPEVLRKVHESFRLSFLKETVFCRSLDESLGGRLATLIGRRNRDIINFMVSQNDYLARVFDLLVSEEATISQKRDAILFTQHLIGLAKGEPHALVASLFRLIVQRGLLDLFRFASRDNDVKARSIGIEIVSTVVDYDPSQVRALINTHPQGQDFMVQLVDSFLSEPSASIINQYADILRSLLISHGPAINFMPSSLGGVDFAGNRRRDPDLDAFIRIFYERYMPRLVSPVTLLAEPRLTPTLKLSKRHEAAALTVCELAITFLRAHSERSHFFLLGSDLLIKAALLLRTPAGHVKLAALRLYRAVLLTKDPLLYKLMIKKALLREVFDLYLLTNNANNLINSACLDLFDCVLKAESPSLLRYFKETFSRELSERRHIPPFVEFLRKTPDEADESSDTEPLPSPEPFRPRDKGSDFEEERYFDTDDDDETFPVAAPRFTPKRKRLAVEEDEDDVFLVLANPSTASKLNPPPQPKRPSGIAPPTPMVVARGQSPGDTPQDGSASPRSTRDSSSPQPRLESPEFTELQKEQIFHYEEEESHIHIEAPPAVDDAALNVSSDDSLPRVDSTLKPYKESSPLAEPKASSVDSLVMPASRLHDVPSADASNPHDKPSVGLKLEGSPLINASLGEVSDPPEGADALDELPKVVSAAAKRRSPEPNCNGAKRFQALGPSEATNCKWDHSPDFLKVKCDKRSCSPDFGSDKPQPTTTPEAS
ncbi:Platinum sensitivity protein [Massospora cicadina]|nr:Platinum sensitivity protein [Massospora cicadina]